MVLSPPAASKFTNRSVRNSGSCKNSNELSKNSPRFPQQSEYRNLDKRLRIWLRCPQSVDVHTTGLSSVGIRYVLLDLLPWNRERRVHCKHMVKPAFRGGSMRRTGHKSLLVFCALPVDWFEVRVTRSICPEVHRESIR